MGSKTLGSKTLGDIVGAVSGRNGKSVKLPIATNDDPKTSGIMFAAPCYAGMVTQEFLTSHLQLIQVLMQINLKFQHLFIKNESLIPRGRNTCAATFLKSECSHLMFIDSDIQFMPDDVASLWNLQKGVACGVYPMKRDDAPYAAWVDGKLLVEESMPKEPFKVDYAGTGFMLIHREVFLRLQKAFPQWKYEESYGEAWAFFQDPIEDGFHLSEDYFFCKRYREIGGEVWMDPQVRLKHVGNKVYG